MIRSMTGFGEAERDSPLGRLRLEVKTVNHRFFNSSVKTPFGFDKYEASIVEALKRHISRGHVTAYLALDRGTEAERILELDVERAHAYHAALDKLRHELNVSGSVDLHMMAGFGDLFRPPERERSVELDVDLVVELTDAAASSAKALREAEGRRLEADLRARLQAIGEVLDAVERRAPERLVEQRDRLRTAVRELTEQVEVDDDRLAREIAYLAERWDVNEEVVRFRSHVELFAEALAGDGSEPVGKRLGFLAQEMLREANTIGSKANDAEMAGSGIALKEEIERIREQVENVE
jgi:uncharacterized protein (TIGR00255 family)